MDEVPVINIDKIEGRLLRKEVNLNKIEKNKKGALSFRRCKK